MTNTTWCTHQVGSCGSRGHAIAQIMAASLCLSASTGCIPTQRARAIQIETYQQTYTFCSVQDGANILAAIMDPARDAQALAQEQARWMRLFTVATTNTLLVLGHVVFSLSIHPADARQFFIEGTGRHIIFVKNKSGERLLLTSTEFQIVDDGPHWISELDEGLLTLHLRQRATRQPEAAKIRFVHTADIFTRIHLKKIADGIFMIDYTKEHEVAIPTPWDGSYGERVFLRPVGYVQFDGPRDGRKLIHLGSRRWIKSYDDELRHSKYPKSGGGPVIEWLDPKPCPPLQSGPAPGAAQHTTTGTGATPTARD